MKVFVSKITGLLRGEETPRKYLAVFGVILIAALVCELFVFNYKWVSSAFDTPVTAAPSGAEVQNGRISFSGQSGTVQYNDLNTEIKYIHVSPAESGQKAEITVSASDEGNSSPLSAPAVTVLKNVERSQYIRLNFSGDIKDLTIRVSGVRAVEDIGLNVNVPLMFSWQRFLIFALICMLAYLLRPHSFVYKYKADLSKNRQKLIAAALIIVQAVFFWNMIHWNSTAITWHENYDHHRQYYELIEAFKDGHLYLDKDIPERLLELENPYDYSSRMSAVSTALWDNAYFEGKCYVYFGVVPALLLYLPYNLITGGELPNYVAVYIFGIFVMVGILLLLWEIVKKWFKNVPLALLLMLSVVFGAVSVLGYAVYKPDFYLVPSISALAFGLFGLYFWISADSDGELISWRLVLGSLCVALTAGCRPQFLLVAAVGIAFYWTHIFKMRRLFSKNSLRQTLAVCLPFVVAAIGIMWYNYARFGSPFDFGANYNLTTNDMTARGWKWGRTGLGLFSYLFQPINVDAVFPFLNDFSAQTTYQGLTLTEKMVGGVFWLFPILVFGLWGAAHRRSFKYKRAHSIICVCLVLVAVLAIVDAQMAGLLTRYFTDFVWLGMIAACVTIFSYYDSFENGAPQNAGLINTVNILSAVTIALVFLRIFAHTEDSIMEANPMLYYTVQSLVAFWM
ncbi:MAG TPA: hypothetical protein H9900_04415 [Candidatus Monoglobus merdigallinarum]|uniref:Uncharacterized protein n=1 Tax=Candidatus Monoglobus merdigallinarum TaxID=2838698 RepID=A0A9D1PS29_9FIRM|nr:hypothetical protein [Candidatus Monoglobus merdigallinarum]